MRNMLTAALRILTIPFRGISRLVANLQHWFSNLTQPFHQFFFEEVEDTPITEALARSIEHPAGLLEHLDALRKHLLRSLAALALTTAGSFAFFRQILAFLVRPLPGGVEALVAIEVTEPVGTVMRVSLLSGFALALPYIVFELWLFVAPGLHRRSRLLGLLVIPLATLFFIGGMAFAYFIMLPAALPFLLNFMGIPTTPRPSSYVGFVTGLMFWVGVFFEFPLVISLLARLGWVRAEALAKQWKLAIVIIAVIAAVITPTVDPVNMSLVMAPMIVLYFLSIVLAKFAQPKREMKSVE